jgi:phosphohistidine phosphatase
LKPDTAWLNLCQMKTLYIVRHAKSSWDDPDQDDFERPLNERGRKDAPRMGKRLNERGIAPDLIISSPAARALETAELMANVLEYSEKNIQKDRSLYHAGSESLLKTVQQVDNKNEIVMLFGHNPGLTEFANDLLGENISNIPTAGVLACQMKTDSWKGASMGGAKLLFFDYPKNK